MTTVLRKAPVFNDGAPSRSTRSLATARCSTAQSFRTTSTRRVAGGW